MKPLALWDTFTREEAHAIFDPEGTFTPQTGTWGLQGIVALKDRPGSYVFFVTFGKKQGDHEFDESITAEGVLTWQSQPKQGLSDTVIKNFIAHDDRTHSIHLFLRTNARAPYYYFGTLGYLSHDRDREQPVHFQWQLLDWPAPEQIRAELDGVHPSVDSGEVAEPPAPRPPGTLEWTPPPPPSKPGGSSTRQFKAKQRPALPDRDARNAKLGLDGEKLVLRCEKQRLIACGRQDLADKVVHVSVVEGDGAGYDVRSFNLDGSPRYLEVKTTRGAASSAFFISPNEVEFSATHPDHFVLLRVYDYDQDSDSARCYEIPGAVRDSFALTITEYRACRTS